ncbi:MAG: hypothetical protein AAF821_25470 [Cyanobacteria bacterium P01_D01_bin.156]
MNVLKLLFNPVFLLAAGLHAGLLLIPIAGGSSEEVVPAPDPQGESITVTRIPPKQTAAAPSTVRPPAQVVRQSSPGSPNRQPRSGQRPSTPELAAPTATSGNTRNRQAARDRNNNPAPGLPELPATSGNPPGQVPVTTPPSNPSLTPSAPTLTALRDGVGSRAVPELLTSFLARLRYSLAGTRDGAAEEAKQAWLAQLADQPGIEAAPPQDLEETLTIGYPITVEHQGGPRRIQACLSPHPQPALLGVVVNQTRDLVVEPTLLRSSGYEFLDTAALSAVEDYAYFPGVTSESQQIYTIPVAVDYDAEACVDLAQLSADS